jgi:hypothetical protein
LPQSNRNLLRLLYATKYFQYLSYQIWQWPLQAFQKYSFYDAKFNNFFPFPSLFHLASLILLTINRHNSFFRLLNFIDCL